MILDCLQTGENATILPLCILVPQYDKINTRLGVWNKWIKKERNKKFGKVNNGWKKKKKNERKLNNYLPGSAWQT